MSKLQILNVTNMSFNDFAKNKILSKISEFTVLCYPLQTFYVGCSKISSTF